MISLTPSSSSTPKTSFDFLKNNNPHTLSLTFSSPNFLTTKQEEAPVEPNQTLNMNNINPKDKEKKAPEDPEIGVFGAEKYFNGDMDSSDHTTIPTLLSLSNTEPASERIFVARKSTGTPSVRSESSWDSQSTLLQNKAITKISLLQSKNYDAHQKMSNKKKSFLKTLGCRCACSDGNSVDVDENITSEPVKIETQTRSNPNSSENFRIIQKKRTVLPWETRTEEDGGESDASSDLFEIESLKEKPKLSLTRQGSDPASPTCYAPSEVSIEWSVVTASVADFSVMSECATSPIRKHRSSQIPKIPNTLKSSSNGETAASQRRKPSSGSLLMGCKSHKSVRVSGDSYTNINKTPNYVHRFPMETQRKINTSSIPRLYIQ